MSKAAITRRATPPIPTEEDRRGVGVGVFAFADMTATLPDYPTKRRD